MKKIIVMSLFTTLATALLSGCNKHLTANEQQVKSEKSDTTKAESIDQLKIDTIKKMYAENQKHRMGNETLYHYSNDHFRSLIDMTIKVGEVCGIHHDVLMQSQDPDYSQYDYRYNINPQGHVTVTLNSSKSVDFQLECNDGKCLVNDVYEDHDPLSEIIKEECTDDSNSIQSESPLTEVSVESPVIAPSINQIKKIKQEEQARSKAIKEAGISMIQDEFKRNTNDGSLYSVNKIKDIQSLGQQMGDPNAFDYKASIDYYDSIAMKNRSCNIYFTLMQSDGSWYFDQVELADYCF